MGDIGHIMPAVHPYMSGATGIGHGNDYIISDKEMGYLAPAKALSRMAVDLLYGQGEEPGEVMEKNRPAMTKNDYLDFQKKVFQKEVYSYPEASKTA